MKLLPATHTQKPKTPPTKAQPPFTARTVCPIDYRTYLQFLYPLVTPDREGYWSLSSDEPQVWKFIATHIYPTDGTLFIRREGDRPHQEDYKPHFANVSQAPSEVIGYYKTNRNGTGHFVEVGDEPFWFPPGVLMVFKGKVIHCAGEDPFDIMNYWDTNFGPPDLLACNHGISCISLLLIAIIEPGTWSLRGNYIYNQNISECLGYAEPSQLF